jgi:hypothetical protein
MEISRAAGSVLSGNQHRWKPVSFCRTREALERLLPGKAEEIRAKLPVRFPETASLKLV